MATDYQKTIALTLASLSGGGQNIKFGLLMAGSTVATLPILVLFLFVQKYLLLKVHRDHLPKIPEVSLSYMQLN